MTLQVPRNQDQQPSSSTSRRSIGSNGSTNNSTSSNIRIVDSISSQQQQQQRSTSKNNMNLQQYSSNHNNNNNTEDDSHYDENVDNDDEQQQHPSNDTDNIPSSTSTTNVFVPNTNEMILLCIDYLRNDILRNTTPTTTAPTGTTGTTVETNDTGTSSNPNTTTQQQQQSIMMKEYKDYISIACWALQQSLLCSNSNTSSGNSVSGGSSGNNITTTELTNTTVSPFMDGTDAWIPIQPTANTAAATAGASLTDPSIVLSWPPPSLEIIYEQINCSFLSSSLHTTSSTTHNSRNKHNDEKKEPDIDDPLNDNDTNNTNILSFRNQYEYDDDHSSNMYRIYNHGSNSSISEPFQLQQLVTIGIQALQQQQSSSSSLALLPSISSRMFYDTQLILSNPSSNNHNTNSLNTNSNELFHSYYNAVLQKGFFHDCLVLVPTIMNDNDDDNTQNIPDNHSSILQDEMNQNNNTTTTITITNEILYEEKFRKVVTKFRNKYLASMMSTVQTNHQAMTVASSTTTFLDYNTLLQKIINLPPTTTTLSTNSKIMVIDGIPIPTSYIQSIQYRHRIPIQMMITSKNVEQQQQYPYHDQHHHHHSQQHHATTIQPSESMISYYSTVPPSPSDLQNQKKITATTTTSNFSSTNQNHPTDIVEAEKYKNLGNSYMQQKLYEKAIECYTTALQYAPYSTNAHVYYSNRAAAYISMKKFNHAIQDSERSLILVPTYGKGHARLGLAYFLSGQYRNAVEAYTVALKYDPNNHSSRNYLEKSALRLAEQEQMEQQQRVSIETSMTGNNNSLNSTAIQPPAPPISNTSFSVISEMERSSSNNNSHIPSPIKHSPATPSNYNHHTSPSTNIVGDHNNDENASYTNDTVIKEAERYKMKGNTYMSQKDYQNAIVAYTKAIQLLPNDVQKSHVYYSNRAAAYCYLEQYHDAEQDATCAIQIVPTYGKAYARLGLSRFLLKNYVGAIEAYEIALQYDPNNTASQSYLLKAQQKLKASTTMKVSSATSSVTSAHTMTTTGTNTVSSNNNNLTRSGVV